MRKKVFSLMAVVLFMGSALNATNIAFFGDKKTCTLVAQTAYNFAIAEEGADHPTAVAYSNIVYNNCMSSTDNETN